jgi:hypothetical protein
MFLITVRFSFLNLLVATSKSKFQAALFLQQRKESEGEMEGIALFTGSNIFVTSSSLLSTTNSNTTRITSQLCTTATHLSAFPSKSHLFSSSSTSSYAKIRSTTESGIFLPRLIAALVCSLFLLSPICSIYHHPT